MANGTLTVVALVTCVYGMMLLSLTLKPHWDQVYTTRSYADSRNKALRVAGASCLAGSLVCCVSADHPTVGSLVWIMLLTVSTLIVALLLALRPRCLFWCALWVR